MQVLHALDSVRRMANGRLPGQLIVQMTDRCNAQCPQCGMRATAAFKRSDLGLDEVKRLIDAAAARGVQAISFTGGEPFLRLQDLTAMINHAGRAGIPYIRTGTNGFLFMRHGEAGFLDRVRRLADTLAATPVRNLWISIDSARPDTHERMRGFPNVTAGIRKALPEFHARGLYPAANLGLNRNLGGAPLPHMGASGPFDCRGFAAELAAGLRRFYNHAIDLGFTMANTCYPMCDDTVAGSGDLAAVYAATSSDDVVRFSRQERALLFSTLQDIIPEFRARIRVFTPLCSLLALSRFHGQGWQTPNACRGGVDYFFIDAATGDTYPCGYRGLESCGKFRELDTTDPAQKPHCTECDWECFRDLSELFGPLADLLSRPIETVRRFATDHEMTRLWMQDLRYHRACGFFDGRRPANYGRLERFGYRPTDAVSGASVDCRGYPSRTVSSVPAERL